MRPAIALSVAAPALALGQGPRAADLETHQPRLDDPTLCIQAASAYHSVNPWLVAAILSVESGFKPGAVNRNQNGTVDMGMAQINSSHFSRLRAHGVTPQNLLDGCVATYVAAWMLAERIRENGLTWFGVASYHSKTPCYNKRYAAMIRNRLRDWGVLPGARERVHQLVACRKVAQPAMTATSVGSGSLAFEAD